MCFCIYDLSSSVNETDRFINNKKIKKKYMVFVILNSFLSFFNLVEQGGRISSVVADFRIGRILQFTIFLGFLQFTIFLWFLQITFSISKSCWENNEGLVYS